MPCNSRAANRGIGIRKLQRKRAEVSKTLQSEFARMHHDIMAHFEDAGGQTKRWE